MDNSPISNVLPVAPAAPVEKVKNGPVDLTEDQKLIILNEWNSRPDNPPSLPELNLLVWGPNIDTRSFKGKAVRDFLVTRNLKYSGGKYVKKPEIILTDEQKKFISENLGRFNYTDIAEKLFNKPLQPRSLETLTVIRYAKEIEPVVIAANAEKENNPLVLEEYRPPKRVDEARARVNKYILNCIGDKEFENTKVQNELKAIIRFCHQHRFCHYINTLKSKQDRELFEGRYISQVYEKSDLSEPELELIINLCCDILDHSHMREELVKLQTMFDNSAADSNDSRVAMSIVEAIKNLRENSDRCSKRIDKLTEVIQGKRNERIDVRVKAEQSLISLIDFWKNYENRQMMLKLAKARENKIKDEIKRIEDMPSLVAEIWGISSEEI